MEGALRRIKKCRKRILKMRWLTNGCEGLILFRTVGTRINRRPPATKWLGLAVTFTGTRTGLLRLHRRESPSPEGNGRSSRRSWELRTRHAKRKSLNRLI